MSVRELHACLRSHTPPELPRHLEAAPILVGLRMWVVVVRLPDNRPEEGLAQNGIIERPKGLLSVIQTLHIQRAIHWKIKDAKKFEQPCEEPCQPLATIRNWSNCANFYRGSRWPWCHAQ